MQNRVSFVRRDPSILLDHVRCCAERPSHVLRDFLQGEAVVQQSRRGGPTGVVEAQGIAKRILGETSLIELLAQPLRDAVFCQRFFRRHGSQSLVDSHDCQKGKRGDNE